MSSNGQDESSEINDKAMPPAASRSMSMSITTTFTFVNQASDLKSVADKKITNRQQRHVIRSHVMRGVRQNEADQGRKRSSGRESTKKKSDREQSLSSSGTPSIRNISRTPSVQDVKIKAEVDVMKNPSPLPYAIQSMRYSPSPSTYSPGLNMIDPFASSPTPRLKNELVDSLLQYCFSYFLPMTFPLERKRTNMVLDRRGAILQVRSSMQATFLGLLATLSAHRAIYQGRHSDLIPSNSKDERVITDQAYHVIKHEALVTLRKKLGQGPPDNMDAFQACYGVLATAVLMGDFFEARMHLQGIQKLLQNSPLPSEAADWVHHIDVVAAMGTLTKPLIPISWHRQSIPDETLSRIQPIGGSDDMQFTTGFASIQNLSSRLLSLLPQAATICHLCEFNEQNVEGLTGKEHVVLRTKVMELEHDLLSYVYDVFPADPSNPDEVLITPLEAVVRVTILGLIHTASTIVPTSSGIGRALTYQQKHATENWLKLRQKQSQEKSHKLDISELRLMVWALFNFTERAQGQPEEKLFLKVLSEMIKRLWLLNIQEVETTLSCFLNVPSIKGSAWRRVWRDVQVYCSQGDF